MKQPPAKPQNSSTSKTVFFISLGILVISCVALAVFIGLNRTVTMTNGKVINTFSKRVFSSRKSYTDQEWADLSYSIEGKEYRGRAQLRGNGSYGQKHIPVYYYPRLPWIAWYYSKTNAAVPFSIVFLVLSGGIMTWSLLYMQQKKRKEQAVRKKK